MKKLLNVLGVLLALAAVGFGFVSCGDGGDEFVPTDISDLTAVQEGNEINFRWKFVGTMDVSETNTFTIKLGDSSDGVTVYYRVSESDCRSAVWTRKGDWVSATVTVPSASEREEKYYLNDYFPTESGRITAEVIFNGRSGYSTSCEFDYTIE